MRTLIIAIVFCAGCTSGGDPSKHNDSGTHEDLASDHADGGESIDADSAHDDLAHAGDMALAPADMSCSAFVSSPAGGQPACTPGPTEYQVISGACYFRNCGCMDTATCSDCFQNPWQRGGGCP